MPANFHSIDMATWPRAQTYHYFAECVTPTAFTVSVSLDVTPLKRTLKDAGVKFFPAMLHIVSSAIAALREFRLALREDTLGYWDYLTPQYPVFHDDDETITFLWTEYDPSFRAFLRRYLDDAILYGDDHGIFSVKGQPPENSYVISCIPWFTNSSVSMHLQDIDGYLVPMVQTGGFCEANGRVFMPLSFTINHAAADGYQVKKFLDAVQARIDHPETWLHS